MLRWSKSLWSTRSVSCLFLKEIRVVFMMKSREIWCEGFITKLRFLSQQLFNEGIFPETFKIAKITSIFNKRYTDFWQTISLLISPCFLKYLEKLMYNKLYIYFRGKSSLFSKQFGFYFLINNYWVYRWE